jgi:aspartate kinase
MIVMKFGGTSLASPASIKRVASIVLTQVQRNPIVVVSALRNTTDQLLGILEHASRAESYLAWKLQEEAKTYHFCIAEDLLSQQRLEPIDQYLRQTFRDLHVRILEVCEGERRLTPELRDWVASLGEELSSRIMAAALQEHGVKALHMDATKLILTDEHFTNATPRCWETYARIRWAIPIAARNHVVVLGGFIGATEDGRTTTLGRGGSDLTASLVGAAVNAEEIQVWKDVDGMLTWDPTVRSGGYRVKNLSYEEADELAKAGAAILHPETIAPAQRLRIPLIIRNTFRPDGEGTRIGIHSAPCFSPVKSIVCKTNITVVELRSPAAETMLTEHSAVIEHACKEQKGVRLLAVSGKVIYLALESSGRDPDLTFPLDHCIEVHVRTNQAVVTLVGQALKIRGVAVRLSVLLTRKSALVLPQEGTSCSLRIVVAQEELAACVDLLEQALFANLDPASFALPELAPEERQAQTTPMTHGDPEQKILGIRTNRPALPGPYL